MNKNEFVASETGEIVEIRNLKDSQYAFIPAPLPPKWKWPEEFWPLLMQAHRAIASLDGIGAYLPEPQLLLQPLQYREAVRSSSLEGTFTPPLQQALFEFDPATVGEDEPTIDSYREISNYGRALRLYFESPDEIPLSLHLIRQLHYVLLENVRGANKEPGKFRQVQNQIGRPPKYVPPPPDQLLDCLEAFEKHLRSDFSEYAPLHDPLEGKAYNPLYDPLVNAFLVHYQFESIHPFLDGNGRVGRLLLSIMITKGCKMSAPWLQMSPYFDTNRDEYIDSLFAVSSKGKWAEWVKFCLLGVVTQAQDTQVRCVKLIDIQKDFKHKLDSIGGNLRLISIIDDLFRLPVVTAPSIANKFNVSYPTARNAIDSLVKLGIITELQPISRPMAFVCPQIIEIIYE